MEKDNFWRGHSIVFKDTGVWTYVDTGQEVKDNPNRDCGHCQLPCSAKGHDGCIEDLPGVMNACCGHGLTSDAYVQFFDDKIIRGQEALDWIAKVKQDTKGNGDTVETVRYSNKTKRIRHWGRSKS